MSTRRITTALALTLGILSARLLGGAEASRPIHTLDRRRPYVPMSANFSSNGGRP